MLTLHKSQYDYEQCYESLRLVPDQSILSVT